MRGLSLYQDQLRPSIMKLAYRILDIILGWKLPGTEMGSTGEGLVK
jgi:hypothetical protein